MGGCGRGEQGKAGAGEPRDAGLDSTEGEGGGGYQLEGLVEDERGHGCWGISPVGDGLGRLVPQRGAACGGHFRWAGGLAQMARDRAHGRCLGE